MEKLGIAHKQAVSCGNARKKYWCMSIVKVGEYYNFILWRPKQKPV